jgi:arginyl-tRNA synthetase
MNILAEIRQRFAEVLADWVPDVSSALEMIRPAQDARFGDFQANCAMPLGKQLGQPPREIAERIVARLTLDDLCEPPEIAGPGFINLRLRTPWLADQIREAVRDERLGIAPPAKPRTYIVDYSSPNVAKPMHVGHIRSTVIGDALYRTLQFLGHTAISDNHLGDWGTQFGMIIHGYKHFADQERFREHPVQELGRLYKLVHQLVEYHELTGQKETRAAQLRQMEDELARLDRQGLPSDKGEAKQWKRQRERLQQKLREARTDQESAARKMAAVENDAPLRAWAEARPDIGNLVLAETARLHAGDAENRKLWETFLPFCREDIQRLYRRLGVRFDEELGESFYHNQLQEVVEDFQQRNLAVDSDGAVCLFLDGFETPMIIRKSDGAFLYATTDLATIKYRMERWNPDVILYVVDSRQGEHFGKLFAAARLWGYDQVDLRHVSFGTVLGEDGKPYKTREGQAASLEVLLDEAISRAYQVVTAIDAAKESGEELSEEQRRRIAEVVGHGAVKYRDLSHNRTSDYVFSFDKMLALEGNTSAYLQYAYARVQNIFARGNVALEDLRRGEATIQLAEAEERQLALLLLRFHEVLEDVIHDYRPNILTSYLYDVAGCYSKFYTQCPVLKAASPELRDSRLLLCDATGRTLRSGLELLGIEVVDFM